MTFALVYLGVAAFLRIKRVPITESFVISLTSTISMIWFYEILYHFSFWDSWNYGNPPYFFLKMNINFIDYGLISLSAVSGYKYMKASKWFWLVLLAMAALWIFWIMIGFPQLTFPKELYNFFLPRIVIDNPHALAYPLNSITKFLLGQHTFFFTYQIGNNSPKLKNILNVFLQRETFLNNPDYSETLKLNS